MSGLFRALSVLVPPDDEDVIRQKICNYLILQCGSYIKEPNLDLATYVSRMRCSQTYGSTREIRVFCELYHFTIVLCHHQQKTQTFSPLQQKKGRSIQKGTVFWDGLQYTAIS